MRFGQRNQFESKKMIQLDGIDIALRNRMYNLLNEALHELGECSYPEKFIVDNLGYRAVNPNYDRERIFKRFFGKDEDSRWYDPYDIFELYFIRLRKFIEETNFFPYKVSSGDIYSEYINSLKTRLNNLLIEENSGYRLIDDQFTKITNESELKEIVSAIDEPLGDSHIAIKNALRLFSDKKNPDYNNSTKEAICAVESACCYINNRDSTLGDALKKLEENGVKIHKALKDAFIKLYGYTSDENGIRHQGVEFVDIPEEDARYMIVSCSSFINYLRVKYSKSTD